MLLIGQIADMFDDSTWTAILVVCLGSPLFGFLIGCIRPRGRTRECVLSVVFYYIVAGATYGVLAFLQRDVWFLVLAFYAAMLFGPIVGFILGASAFDRAE